MELDKLRQLLMLLRDNGVTSYRDGDLELTLGAARDPEAVPGEVHPQESKPASILDRLPAEYAKAFEVIGGR